MQILAQVSKEVKFPRSPKNTALVGGNGGRLLSFTTALLGSCRLNPRKATHFLLFFGNKYLRQPIIQQLNSLFDFVAPVEWLALQKISTFSKAK